MLTNKPTDYEIVKNFYYDENGDNPKNYYGEDLKFIFPENNQYLHFMFAQPQSGKSYYIGQLIKQYHKQFPKRKIIYVGQHSEGTKLIDDAITNHFKNKNLVFAYPMDDFLNGNPLDVEKLKRAPTASLIIFDDIDAYNNKERLIINSVRDQILKQGRAHNQNQQSLDCITTNHSAIDYKNTKYVIENCIYITFFINGTTKHQVETTLNKLLEKEDIAKIKQIMNNTKGKYQRITIHLRHPKYILTNDNLFLL